MENTLAKPIEEVKAVTVLMAGDSGDGIQLTGNYFTTTHALFGNDVSTFPNFPAEIRAPQGTLAGVSGFQIHFGSENVYTPGDMCDALVVMNAAGLKANLQKLKEGGIIIANISGFDPKNLKLARYNDGDNPLENDSLIKYKVFTVDLTKLTRTCLEGTGLGTKEMDRSKNMFALGFLFWLYNRELNVTLDFLKEKFKSKPELYEANEKVLRAGYNYGETVEAIASRYNVKAANLPKGSYRHIMGNQATAIGLIAASKKSGLDLFYATYPITPASDILHELSRHKNFGVRTFQAEDEIAAVCAAIGASYGGALGVTASSGPGIALKGEAIGLAVMYELPLLIINVQRGGPSTGLPTKTEQADLLQAMYGRNGEAPVPVVAASTPSDCFEMVMEAARIAVEHMTPVFFLSDGYIANGAEPWRFPSVSDLKDIKPKFAAFKEGETFLPYKRDEKLVREWAVPGVKGLEHRIGGIEKQHETGSISYDPDNHQFMVNIRQKKVETIANYIPLQTIDNGKAKGKVLVLGWGSTYGAIKVAVKELIENGHEVSHAHIKYLNPFPKNLGELIASFDKVLIPEMNMGQLVKIIKSEFKHNEIHAFNKVKGIPFTSGEIVEKVKELY